MAVAPEAPEGAGVAVLLALSLLAMLGWVAARGLGYAWRYTIGGVLTAIGSALPHIHFFSVHVNLGQPFIDLANTVSAALEGFAARSEAAAGYFFHTAAWLLRTMALQLQDAVFATERAIHWLTGVFVPTYVHGVTDLLHTATRTTSKVVQRAETRVVHVTRIVRVEAAHVARVTVPDVALPHVQEWEWITRHWKGLRRAVVGAAVGAAGLALPGWLSREWFGLTKRTLRIHNLRLSRLEKLLGAAGAAAIMANALGLPNWRCITRGNLGRVSRALCGLPTNFLNDLLGLLADFFVLTNICTVLPWVESAASEIGTPLVALLTEAGAGLCTGSAAPGALQGPAPVVPPVYLPGVLSSAV